LRPTKADLIEVQVGVMRADVMEDARDRSAHTVIEPLGGVGMGGTTCIFAFGVPDRVVGGEGPTVRIPTKPPGYTELYPRTVLI
jgi:hypothetical protein